MTLQVSRTFSVVPEIKLLLSLGKKNLESVVLTLTCAPDIENVP